MSILPPPNTSPGAQPPALCHLPDVAASATMHATTLDWVGMEAICLPVRLAGQSFVARADVGVSLDDSTTRGIHMSRLYLALRDLEHRELEIPRMRAVLNTFLRTHHDLSGAAFLTLAGEVPLERPALVSALAGWKAYPFRIEARYDPRGWHFSLEVEIGYSSTCPCSAALARQAIQEQFDQDFADQAPDAATMRDWLGGAEAIVATPHSQRSEARVRVNLEADGKELPLERLIDLVENALGTALQTAVKRADEKAFALANGRNLMFCEDAARVIDNALRPTYQPVGYSIRVCHRESLHAHDAVARLDRFPPSDH